MSASLKPPARRPVVSHPAKPLSAIVPGWLDDAEMLPSTFRVYCRIARRAGKKGGGGECFERLNEMATGCKLRRATVQKALRVLVESGFIEEEQRPGRTTIYRIASNPPLKASHASENDPY